MMWELAYWVITIWIAIFIFLLISFQFKLLETHFPLKSVPFAGGRGAGWREEIPKKGQNMKPHEAWHIFVSAVPGIILSSLGSTLIVLTLFPQSYLFWPFFLNHILLPALPSIQLGVRIDMEEIHRTLRKSVQHSGDIFENIEEIHDFLVKYNLPKLIQKKREENLN